MVVGYSRSLSQRPTTDYEWPSLEGGETDDVAAGLLHVELRAAIEGLVTRLEQRSAGCRFFGGIDVVDCDEQRDRVSAEVLGAFRMFRGYARLGLIHHLDPVLLGAGEKNLAVGSRNLVLDRESKPIDPERQTGL